MITEIRPGTWQTMIGNVLWTFRAPTRKEAEAMVKAQTERYQRRQGKSITRKLWSAKNPDSNYPTSEGQT